MSATANGVASPELFSPDDVTAALRLIMEQGGVTELRALYATTASDRWEHTYSGYFDDIDKLVESLSTIKTAKGIYITPNALDPALLSRSYNRSRKTPRGESTSDTNIVRRRWLLIDCDPHRPSGVSSTNVEHDAALAKAHEIDLFLHDLGLPEGIIADSGNGAHLLLRIDLAADDGGLISRVLNALADRFDDEAVKIDRKVFNPARIWKLYGTRTCKGDDTPDRPHRMAKILHHPDTMEVVSEELLRELAGTEPPTASANGQSRNGQPYSSTPEPYDVQGLIDRHGFDVEGPHDWMGAGGTGKRWVFNASPMCDHDDKGPYILQHASGAVSAACHHDSCNWTWADLRARFDPKPERPALPAPDRQSASDCSSEGGDVFHVKEAEQQVLGSIVKEPSQVPTVAELVRPREFVDPHNRAGYSAILDLHQSRAPIDRLSVTLKLKESTVFSRSGIDPSEFMARAVAAAGNGDNAPYYAQLVADAHQRQRIAEAAEHIAKAARDGTPAGELITDWTGSLEDVKRVVRLANEIHSFPLDEFLRQDHRQRFLINGVVTEGQPGCVSAKSKTNKTTIALAMALAINTGQPFLGHYEVPEPQPVGFISAESGGATLAESFQRVAASMGVFASDLKELHISTEMPLLTTPEGLDRLERHIVKYGLKTQFIDPTYKAFAGVEDTQLSQMALHLFPLSEIIDRTGCSIIMVHHNRKSPARQGDHYAEPTQDDIQGTGFQQWARFFLLLNKRREWDANTGQHWLWLKTEGSAGFGSRYFLDLCEGLRTDPGGRIFDVKLTVPTEGAAQEREEQAAKKEGERLESDRRAVCAVLVKEPDGISWSRALKTAGVSERRWELVKETMYDLGDVEDCEIKTGNHKTLKPGIKLARKEIA